MKEFDKVSLGIFPTPIHKLDNISRLLGAEIFVKRDDMTGIGLGGNKVRKLEYLLADAKAQGAKVVFTTGGAQSNHAMLTAAAARKLGMTPILILKKRGVKLHLNSMVKNVEETAEGTTVNFITKEVPGAATGEVVLCAIGRKPYMDGLFTEDCKPEMNGKSIKVDERYQTSIPGVYAIGDVSAKIQLAHVASAQGTACVEMLCGEENHVSQTVVPSCI